MTGTPNIEAAVERAAGFVQAQWQLAVMGSQVLPGMQPVMNNIQLRRLYANSIATNDQIAGGNGISQQVVATSKIAEQLENGCPPFDMKPALLNGPKARTGKNGRYNIIPFRQGTSNKHAPNSNFPAMPKDVYKQARALKASIKQGNAMKWGGKLPAQGGLGQNPTSRIEKQYRAATQNKYMTFRIVSDKSAPGSWMHPGYKPHNIVKAVSDFCRPAVEAMIQHAAELDLQSAVVNVGAI